MEAPTNEERLRCVSLLLNLRKGAREGRRVHDSAAWKNLLTSIDDALRAFDPDGSIRRAHKTTSL